MKFFGSRKEKSPDKKEKRVSEIVADEVRPAVEIIGVITCIAVGKQSLKTFCTCACMYHI